MQGQRLVTVTAAAFMALAGATVPARADIKVVATIKPLHALVARVMEGVGTPAVLVGGQSSPHTYAMKPSDAKALNDADVFFRIGESIEPFTRKIVASLPASVEVSTLVEAPGITLLGARTGGAFEATHNHSAKGEHHASKDTDHEHQKSAGHEAHHAGHDDHGKADHRDETPSRDHHIWLDPRNAKAMVGEIARVLAAKAPDHARTFAANAAKLDADLDALSTELAAKLQPVAGKPFVVFHDAYQYFERRFDLDAVGSITVSPDVKPSAKRLTEIRKKIGTLGAVCVFAEPNFEPKLLAAVIEGTKSRTGTLDPEGLALTPGPDAYFKLMRGLSDGLAACLHQGS